MIRLFKQYISPRRALFVIGEGILIYFSVVLAAVVILWEGLPLWEFVELIWSKVLLVAVVTQISLYFNDLYEFKITDNLIDLGTRLVQAIGITSIVLAVIYFLWPDAMIGRWIFFTSIVFVILFLISWRFLYAYVLQKRLFSEKAVMIGNGELAEDILKELEKRRDITYDIRAIIVVDSDAKQVGNSRNIPVQIDFEKLFEQAEKVEANSIIVALDQKRGVMPYDELLSCKVKGKTIIDGESFYERITGKILVEKINPSWLIFSDGFVKSKTSRFMKRTVGLILSLLMFVVLLPLMILTAVIIKIDSRGPVLFSQERVGENEENFTLYKFRSMRADAEKESGPVWAGEDDPRITRVGRIIRRLRIDELPQLWNVLKGDMSFVGPRPERPFFVEKLKNMIPYYRERFTVKPGVTGWAQVRYPYGATEEDALEKLKYELYYIKNMSLVMDLMVILHTVKIVLLGRGSR